MPSNKEFLAHVEADTNAISAAQKGLAEVAARVNGLIALAKEGKPLDTGLTDLQSLVAGLQTAVPASVVPASAGAVGKSRSEQVLETAEALVREHMARLAEITQSIINSGEHLRASAQAIAEAKAFTKD